MDTDTLIALVSSLLDAPIPHEQILDALTANNGDVEASAHALGSNSQSTRRLNTQPQGSATKRKRTGGLEAWLRPPPEKRSHKQDNTFNPTVSSPSTTKSPLTKKPVVNFMNILKQAPSSPKKSSAPKLPPLTLTNPTMVSDHTPCTLHSNVLPPELACSLFYTMFRDSEKWKRNRWWMFDKIVESPHLTSFWARKTDGVNSNDQWQKAARHWYNGRETDPPKVFPEDLEAACLIVEKVVNEQLKKRQRLPLEWAGGGLEGDWRANVAASNRYLGGDESVGFHSDQLTGIGPYATIASISLGVTRKFTLREVIPKQEKGERAARTFNIPLAHNSLIIMHGSCQERFKHSVPPQPTIDLFHPLHPPPSDLSSSDIFRTRINITLRFYRPDFHPDSIPKCRCGIPTILRPDMKNHSDGQEDRYWWTCYAGAQQEGKGCDYWEVMAFDHEGRGPAVKNVAISMVQEPLQATG